MKDLRKLILRCVLGALAFAAASGVLTALTRSDLLERLMGTGFATAAAALLMLPLSLMIDRPTARTAGLVAVAAVTFEFILALMLVWEVWRALTVQWDEGELFITAGFALLAAVGAIVFLLMLYKRQTRTAAMAGLAVTAAFFAASMIGTWLSASRMIRDQIWTTAWTIGGFGVLAAAALVGFGSDRRHWRWVGVVASVSAAAMLIVETWTPAHRGKEIFSLLCAASAYVAWANVIIRVPLPGGQRWLLLGTLLAGAATAFFSELIGFDIDTDLVKRLDTAAGILAGCGTLALAVLATLRRRVDYQSLPSEFQQITVICPACRKKQTIALGGAFCEGCGLRIEVRAEVPRCATCGYLLYRLTSGVCPECGKAVSRDAPSG